MPDATATADLQTLLDALPAGGDAARNALLSHSRERFARLARRMFPRTSRLRHLGETDDVLQRAMIRLHKALGDVAPTDVPAWLGLAARHIRWTLHDMARELASPVKSWGGPSLSDLPHEPVAPDAEPADFLEWAEFHERAGALPDDEREVFDVLFYDGLTQEDAAAVLHLSERTVRRRWQRARLLLAGVVPDDGGAGR